MTPTRNPADPVVMERNPYYWQVDIVGNQLPYVDAVAHAFYVNAAQLRQLVAGGKIDMQLRGIDVATTPSTACSSGQYGPSRGSAEHDEAMEKACGRLRPAPRGTAPAPTWPTPDGGSARSRTARGRRGTAAGMPKCPAPARSRRPTTRSAR